MSCDQLAFMMKDKVPNREAWQQAIDACGFDFQLHPELNPWEDTGFSPCQLFGKEAGFEIGFDDSQELLDDFADIRQGRDCCIVFTWRISMADCACAMIASYALAKAFDAIAFYAGDEPYETLADFYNDTMGCIEDAKKELR